MRYAAQIINYKPGKRTIASLFLIFNSIQFNSIAFCICSVRIAFFFHLVKNKMPAAVVDAVDVVVVPSSDAHADEEKEDGRSGDADPPVLSICDLGELTGDVLLYGGPYSNAHALEALFNIADERCIVKSNRICTGDVVAYCGEPARTVALIRERGGPVLAGNCEKQLASNAQDCGCGFDESSTCSLLSVGWYSHALRSLQAGEKAWMGKCPDRIIFTHSGRKFALVHGAASDISRFLWSVSNESEFEEEIALLEQEVGEAVDVIISGHSGIAFQRRVGSHLWVNAGAIGMPENNGDSQTRYAILDSVGIVRICKLEYDALSAKASMESAGLRQGYHEALLSGHWPSEDVLPERLKRAARASRSKIKIERATVLTVKCCPFVKFEAVGASALVYGKRKQLPTTLWPLHCLTGPDLPCQIGTFSLILIPSSLWLWKVTPRIGDAATIVGSISTCIVVLSLACAGFSDPGIVQRPRHLGENIDALNEKGEVFCSYCKMYRPHGAIHCARCDACIVSLDHHCPWTGKCIGKKNLRFFYIFLMSLCFHFLLFIVVTIAAVVAGGKTD